MRFKAFCFFYKHKFPFISQYAFPEVLLVRYNRSSRRGVAQPGSVLVWGTSGRRFKSSRPDQFSMRRFRVSGFE